MSDLDRVVENILSERSPILQPTDKPYQLVVKTVDVGFEDGSLTFLLNAELDLLTRLFDCFLDPRRVYTTCLLYTSDAADEQ